jgi:hypothetical protein
MGNIPFTAENLRYVDQETGVIYEMAQPTDSVEIAMINFENNFERDGKLRLEVFNSNEAEYRWWVNGHIDIILKGWSGISGLPQFPEAPSLQMCGALKTKLLLWWNAQNTFTRDDLKK